MKQKRNFWLKQGEKEEAKAICLCPVALQQDNGVSPWKILRLTDAGGGKS